MDVRCAVCGEPWDSYGITYLVGEGDLTKEEVKLFRKGEGCPSCNFGACDECGGKGFLGSILMKGNRKPCSVCKGTGKRRKQNIMVFAEDITEASDEDPILVLEEAGII